MRSPETHRRRQKLFIYIDVASIVLGFGFIFFGHWLSGLGSFFLSIYFQNQLSLSMLEEKLDRFEEFTMRERYKKKGL